MFSSHDDFSPNLPLSTTYSVFLKPCC